MAQVELAIEGSTFIPLFHTLKTELELWLLSLPQ